MASSSAVFMPSATLENPLAHLPCSLFGEYRKGEFIYNQERPSNGIYLITDGLVKVCRLADDGCQAIIDIYRTDDFFGESALLGMPDREEQATALRDTKVMTWTASEMAEMVINQPRLGIALSQFLVQRNINFGHRIESFSGDSVARRLARSLVRLAEHLGVAETDGAIHMAALTHDLLAQYVGTSREIVTLHMNRLRRDGYIGYSRKGITLNQVALEGWLDEDGSVAASGDGASAARV